MSNKPVIPNSEFIIPNYSVVFDLDGTLWDARENICLSWNKALSENYPNAVEIPVDAFTAQMGRLLPDIGDVLLDWLDKSERAKALDLCCDCECEYLARVGGRLFDRERETLEALREKYGLYIVSNCQSGYIESFLESTGWGDLFADKLCSGDTGREKGYNIAELMRRNDIEKAIYVGDTQLDLEAARIAGVPFVWAAFGFGRPESFDAKADSFAGLPGAIDALLAES